MFARRPTPPRDPSERAGGIRFGGAKDKCRRDPFIGQVVDLELRLRPIENHLLGRLLTAAPESPTAELTRRLFGATVALRSFTVAYDAEDGRPSVGYDD